MGIAGGRHGLAEPCAPGIVGEERHASVTRERKKMNMACHVEEAYGLAVRRKEILGHKGGE